MLCLKGWGTAALVGDFPPAPASPRLHSCAVCLVVPSHSFKLRTLPLFAVLSMRDPITRAISMVQHNLAHGRK